MINQDPSFVSAGKILDSGTRSPAEMELVESYLAKLSAKEPNNPGLLNAYARLFRRTGKPGLIYQTLLAAQEHCDIEEYSSPWKNLGIFYQDFQMWGKAAEVFKRVLMYHPDDLSAKGDLEKCETERKTICLRFGLSYPTTAPGDALILDTLELLLAARVRVKATKCRLEDNFGQYHEVDILCESLVIPRNPLPFVIECKDWSRAISRPLIDEFRGFLDHSPYKLGMVVVSRNFTKGARASALKSGILVKSLSELENDMEVVLHENLKDKIIELENDYSAGGWSLEEMNFRDIAREKFAGIVSYGVLHDHPEVTIDINGITIDGHRIIWFEPREFLCYENIIGSLSLAPTLILFFYMSWWNSVNLLAKSTYGINSED